MNPKLEELLIDRLSGNSHGKPSSQDQIGELYNSLMEKQKLKQFEEDFMSNIKGSDFGLGQNKKNEEYEAGLKEIFNKNRLIRALGISMSVSVSSMLPINLGSVGLGIRGISQMATGYLIEKFTKGQGSFNQFGQGVFDSGLALAVGGIIPANILSSLKLGGSGTTPATNGNSSQYLE
jgi:hypothetical protein